MITAHWYSDDGIRQIMVNRTRSAHCPRLGDKVRLSEDRFLTVVEVIWCLDEDNSRGDTRVNIRLKPEPSK